MINGRLIFPTGNSILQVAQALEGPAPFSSALPMVSCWAGAQASFPTVPWGRFVFGGTADLDSHVCVPVVLTSVCWSRGGQRWAPAFIFSVLLWGKG